MNSSNRLQIQDESQVGAARRFAAEVCRRLGCDETFSGKVLIVVTEMARNIVRHGGGGEIVLRTLIEMNPPGIEILALDAGKGIANVAESLRDGHSTGGTAGSGLGAIKRLSSEFEIFSLPTRGTAILARIYANESQLKLCLENQWKIGAVSVALESEEVCGDAWDCLPTDSACRFIVADGLGHGHFAEEAAREAVAIFRKYPKSGPAEMLQLAHLALGKTRGAAASVVELSKTSCTVTSAGVGNVSMRLFKGEVSKSLVSDNGTLGASLRRIGEFKQSWDSETLLIMHSDGLSAQWNVNDYPGLAYRHPTLIAGVLYRDFRRIRDDATVVVVRHRSS